MFQIYESIKKVDPHAQCIETKNDFIVYVSEEHFFRLQLLLKENMPLILIGKQKNTIGPGAIFPKVFWAPQDLPPAPPAPPYLMEKVMNFLRMPLF